MIHILPGHVFLSVLPVWHSFERVVQYIVLARRGRHRLLEAHRLGDARRHAGGAAAVAHLGAADLGIGQGRRLSDPQEPERRSRRPSSPSSSASARATPIFRDHFLGRSPNSLPARASSRSSGPSSPSSSSRRCGAWAAIARVQDDQGQARRPLHRGNIGRRGPASLGRPLLQRDRRPHPRGLRPHRDGAPHRRAAPGQARHGHRRPRHPRHRAQDRRRAGRAPPRRIEGPHHGARPLR